MIRNIVVGRLRPGVELTAIQPGLDAVAALAIAGRTDCRVGTDLRLRDDPWDFAITADFVNEASYQAYDHDAEHNRVRAELFAPFCADFARVQFRLD